MRRMVLPAALMAAMVTAGCSGAERPASGGEADAHASHEAGQRAPGAADLPAFPMPEAPAGEDLVRGPVRHAAAANPAAPCTGSAERRDGLIAVAVTGLTLNCCTDTIRAGVEAAGTSVVIRLYEYLRDPCECTHRRDVTLELAGLEGVTTCAVILNDRPTPAATFTF